MLILQNKLLNTIATSLAPIYGFIWPGSKFPKQDTGVSSFFMKHLFFVFSAHYYAGFVPISIQMLKFESYVGIYMNICMYIHTHICKYIHIHVYVYTNIFACIFYTEQNARFNIGKDIFWCPVVSEKTEVQIFVWLQGFQEILVNASFFLFKFKLMKWTFYAKKYYCFHWKFMWLS